MTTPSFAGPVQGSDEYQVLLQHLGAGVFGVDLEGNFTFLNPAAVTLFGFDSQQAALGANSHRLIHHTDANGDNLPASACRIYQVMAGGQPLAAWRDLFWRADGSSFPVEVYANPVSDDQGRTAGAVVGFHDITEQLERERGLARYQRAFQASRDAIMFSDLNGFIECNPATVSLFEAGSADQLRGRHPGELAPATQPDGTPSMEAAAERINQAFAEGSTFFEWTHRSFTGRTFPAEVLLSRVELGDGPVLQAVVRDISEKKRALEEMQQARRQAEQYFEAARVMNLVLDTQGHIQEINRRGCEVLGLSREAVLGRNWFDTFLADEDRDRMRQVFGGFLSGEIHPGGNLENDVITAGGERRLMAFRHTILRDDGDNILGLLSSGNDITDQRRMEAKLEYLATNDPLTNLFNRHKFEEFLAQELERAERYASPLALIMFDVDHFKAVNDNHGHEAGDRILKQLATLVGQRARSADILGRWGGEEFMILLPETGRDGAEQLAEAIRAEVGNATFPGPGGVTISLGVIEYQAGDRRRDLVKRVDDALYRAKANGRNRVEVG